jgi:hypothetical protein
MDVWLHKLEAAERARMLKTKPATGGGARSDTGPGCGADTLQGVHKAF